MDFIYFNFDLSLVAYLKAFAFNKNTQREVCEKCKIIFSLSSLNFPTMVSEHSRILRDL